MLKINSLTNYTNFNTGQKQGVNRTFKASQGAVSAEDIKPKCTSEKKNSKSATALYILGIAALAALIFSNKITPKKISSHIDFTPAQTFKEAVSFARKKLGISKFEGFNEEKHLPLVNDLNKKFVEISNRKAGNASLPNGVILSSEGFNPEQTATIIKNTGTKYDGWLCINKNEIDKIDAFFNAQELDFTSRKISKEYEKTVDNITNFLMYF